MVKGIVKITTKNSLRSTSVNYSNFEVKLCADCDAEITISIQETIADLQDYKTFEISFNSNDSDRSHEKRYSYKSYRYEGHSISPDKSSLKMTHVIFCLKEDTDILYKGV
jgi:hypothetical protein